MDKRLKFNEPWILQRADPYVYEKDGWYYFTASVPAYDSIVLRRAKKLADLPQAEEVVIWKKHESGPMSKHIWAPELHYLEGKWYIYFAGGEEEDIWKIRPYVLECQGQDPLADASMKDSMWVKTLKFRMLMGCVQMWWKHSKRLRFRYCAGRGDVLRTSITGKTESDRKRTGRK